MPRSCIVESGLFPSGYSWNIVLSLVDFPPSPIIRNIFIDPPPLPDGGRSGAHHVYTSGTTQRYRCKTLTRTLLGGLTQCTICGSLLQEKLPIHSPQMCMCYQWEKGAPAAIKLLIAEHGDSSETERPSNAYGVVLTLPLPIQNTCTVRRNC